MKARKKPNSPSGNTSAIRDILARGEKKEIRALFAFNSSNSDEEVLFKFNTWARWFFPQYFMDETKTRVIPDAAFHRKIDEGNLRVYRRDSQIFVNIAFRGAAKTTRTKLWKAYVIANDLEHRRRYFKVLTKDTGNARQIVTDIYNMFVDRRVFKYYPEIFQKTEEKRTETMAEFDTATGIKMRAGTVGQDQRGQLQDESRPDDIWEDDFETRKVLRSAIELKTIWDNMEEARNGLSRTGGATYTCNYLSERGNVHKLVQKYASEALLVPIQGRIDLHVDSDGNVDASHTDGAPTWPAAYTPEAVEKILKDADDPAGEYLSSPAAGEDVFFPRDMLDAQKKRKPVREIAGFRIFHEYDASHRYGSGHDVAGGVGLDSSTSVFIDFTQFPARVVATFKSNTIKPDTFGDEIQSEADRFGRPIVAPESNNHGHATIGRLKQIYDNIYVMKEKETSAGVPGKVKNWGWNTNTATKPEMFTALKKAVADGHLELSDPDLIAEARGYTRDDFMDKEEDPRLATRHFDLLTAAAIAWQMRNYSVVEDPSTQYRQSAYEPLSEYEGGTGTGMQDFSPMPIHPDNFVQPPYEAGEFEQT